MKRASGIAVVLFATATVLVLLGGVAAANPESFVASRSAQTIGVSGAVDLRGVNFGHGLTECPQGGSPDATPAPLNRRRLDSVEAMSSRGDDQRMNQDYSCFPQNEMSISVNPQNERNIVGGANDYRLGWGTSGFYASTNGGRDWYDGIIPFPSLPSGDNLDGGGDPAVVHDRGGVVYYADINFNRTDDTNGIWVSRSTNGGFTWSRPCVSINVGTPTDDQGRCGGAGDPRLPNDGTVTFIEDENTDADFSVEFNDKEYIAAGPRPAGVEPTCFQPETKTPYRCPEGFTGLDRIYVTWTIFAADDDPNQGSRILMSYSDDQAHSWSPPKAISGSAPFCIGSPGNECAFNQFSVPTVSPTTGALYVQIFNGNTPDEDQVLLVRSADGGQTFQGPFFVGSVFDLNYPRGVNGRTDCNARGQGSTRQVLTNSCFRLNSLGNVIVDKRGGAFADDLYMVISDNRNGNLRFSNTDIFLYKSTNGGSTWMGPTRVNNDVPGGNPAGFNRDCGRTPFNITGSQAACTVIPPGNDQWFPWVDISEEGDLNVVFQDRRLDTDSDTSEWATSRTEIGNYLSWFWGAQCRVTEADSRQCVAPEAATYSGSPTGPIDPGADPVAGQAQATFPFTNHTISDTPFNLDYTFRAGIFMGDYENVAVRGGTAHAMWTDSRNGRSSRFLVGRNPACEQADAFYDSYSARDGGTAATARASDKEFLAIGCPADSVDAGTQPTTQPQPPAQPAAPAPGNDARPAAEQAAAATAVPASAPAAAAPVVSAAPRAVLSLRSARLAASKGGRYVLVRVNGTAAKARVRVTLLRKGGKVAARVVRSVPTNRVARVPNLRVHPAVKQVRVSLG